jgi:glycerol-3-phosphate acyltransferase PlsY
VTVNFLTAALSYLSGSIPFGYLLVKMFRGEDIRTTGSGNIGATNVSRRSPGLGILTLLLDALKGFVPVMVALWWARHGAHGGAMLAASPEQVAARALAMPFVERTYLLASMAAFCAVVGHIFPVWLGFRGGKGVATGLGCWISLAPGGVLVMVLVFVTMVAVFRYISLASITAAAIFPLATWILGDYHHTPAMLGFMAASSTLIIIQHRANIRRLRAGTESPFRMGRK